MSCHRLGAFGTVVPAFEVTRPTVGDQRIQFFASRRLLQCGVSCSGVSAAPAPAPCPRAALSRPPRLPRLSIFAWRATTIFLFTVVSSVVILAAAGCELRDCLAFTCRGRSQVHNGIHRVLVEVPIIWVYGGVVCRSIGGTCLVSQQ